MGLLAIGLYFHLSFFFGFLWLLYFAFTSYYVCGPTCCHFLPCWPTGLYLFIYFFFGLSGPLCFAFTSYCACGPACYHFLPCCPTRPYFFLFFFIGLLWPFTSILLFHSFLLYFCLLLGLSVVGPFFIYQKRVSTTIKSKYFKLRFFLLLFLT